jgi:hypothetical protein
MRRLLAALLLVGCSIANAHDPKRPDLDDWYRGLQSSGAGHCCDKSEAKQLDGSDWDMKDGHYRVRFKGDWLDVPDNALVKQPNLVGPALVWIYFYSPMGEEQKKVYRQKRRVRKHANLSAP